MPNENLKKNLLMKKNYCLDFKGVLVTLLFFVAFQSMGQTTTVFTDDFSSQNDAYYTVAPGFIGSPTPNPKWKMIRSGADFGAAIASPKGLYLTNSGSAANNANGWILANVLSSELSAPYSNTLSNNPGIVTWTFNMRQSRPNPSGFANNGYGVAFILAGTNGTTNLAGTGYAVVLGNAGTTDYIRLVRYNNGIRNFTTLVQSKTSGLTDFGSNYTSIKVTYNPNGNVWELLLRNDGATNAADPTIGALTSQGSISNNTYVGASLPLLGGYLNGATAEGFVAYYKYINVDVDVPYITSIAPNSKVAGTAGFNLVVTGGNFINGTSQVRWNGALRTTTFNSSTQLTAAITAADIASAGTAQVTVTNGSTVSNALVFTIDSPGVPTLTTSASVVNLATTVNGAASTASTYTINGINLTADPVITAPANFEISKDGSNFFDSLTLTRSGFNLTPQPTTIYVRTKSTAVPGNYSSVINNAVSGGSTKQVTIKAKVIATKPTVQSSALTFTTVTSSSLKLNWTSGNGARRIILMRAGSAVNSTPLNENTYVSNSVFGGGAEIGTGNFVVYSGTANNTVVTGLSAATTYYVSIFEYNGTLSGTENYFTTGPLTGNQLTRNAALGLQIYAANTVNTIDFDSTVDGVNTDAFQGSGIGPDGDSGDLNSNAWAITGFSDGNIAFGGTSAEDTDYDSGTSTGGVIDGGLYSFETSPDNFSLGIQATDSDFSPGTITLRIQNQTAVPMTSLNIGYKVYIRNDQASSSTFNFSHSANNSTYTAVSALDVASPGAADVVPEWKAYYRVTTITGISIASGNYYYLRWTGSDAGNVAYDEFALDDIVLVSNPTSTFVPFDGTTESFVLNGNADLSGDLEVVNNITFTGGKLSIGDNNTLSIKGTVTNTSANGIKGGALSNLTIPGIVNKSLSFDQTTPGTTNLLNNFTIASTGARIITILTPIAVKSSLVVDANQTLQMGTNALTGAFTSATINGTLLTLNTSTTPLPVGKTWSGTGIVHYNAAAGQTVVAGTYNSLTISPTAGAGGVAGGNLVVNGILNLPTANPNATTGSLSLGSYTLTMGGTATNTGVGDVTGDILRTSIVANVLYTFGHKDTSIIFPVVPGQTLPTSMGLRVDIGTAATWRASSVKRIYDFKQTGGSGTKAVIRGHYLDSELNGNAESKLVDFAYVVPTLVTIEQGKSNFNTTENWIELVNANVGNIFSSAFGLVKLTFDESELAVLTWNGSFDNSWTTAANWTPSGTPSATVSVIIPDGASTPVDPIINPTSAVLNLTIQSGGILIAPDDSDFTINGKGGAWINNGTFTPGGGTSKVTFTDVDATIAGETTFNNLTIASGGGLRPLSGNIMHIGGAFTKTGDFTPGGIKNTVDFTGTSQTIPVPSGGLAAYNNLKITGTGAVFPTSLNITGDLTLNNTVIFTGKTIVMSGVTPQSIGGANASFNNLIINNTNGNVSLANDTSVNGTLTLTSGQLIINNNKLTLGASAVAGTFDATTMIVTNGTVINAKVFRPFTALGSYFFPIGEFTASTPPAYSPITVNVTSGTVGGGATISVSVKDGKIDSNKSTDNFLTRYWSVNQSGFTNAFATITAKYLPEDVSSAENLIVAAQLKGTFNQITSPWIKFSVLNSNTLTATGAALPGVSTFTGISGQDFSTEITGYGSFCKDVVATLNAQNTGGDAPYTYLWSNGLGTAATATPPTNAIGTVNYSVTVKDANGISATNNASVTVLQPSVGGTLSADQIVCYSSEPQDITLTGNTGQVIYWQKSTDPSFSTDVQNIANLNTTLTRIQAGLILSTTYFRAVIGNGSCAEIYSGTTKAEIVTTTWNGTVWSNGVPDGTKSTVINVVGDYTIPGNLVACSFRVESGNVIIPDGVTLTVNGAVFTSNGSMLVQNDGSLLQTDNLAVNVGTNFTAKRAAKPMIRYDFTYWSSPVVGQTLKNLSLTTLFDKYFGWDPSAQNWIPYNYGTHVMEPGLGYSVRAPQSTSTTVPAAFTGSFSGTPNNGVIQVPVVGNGGYNLLGNPYASALSADLFIAANTDLGGTLYFWTHNTAPSSSNGYFYTYAANDYASYNYMGGTGTAAAGSGTASNNNNIPNGKIASGQGFFAKGKTAPQTGTATFNNAMRISGNNNQFFKADANVQNEKHRIWLNISNTNASFRQMLIGYTTNATSGYDNGWDGELMSNSLLTVYSFVGDKKLAIQALPLPFVTSNVDPIGFQTNFAGSHRIALDQFDGLFENQNIYLHDKSLEIVHDLKIAPYDFVTAVGTFDERFEIVYVNSMLGTGDFDLQNQVYVYKEKETIVVKSPLMEMKTIKVIDMQGRIIQTFDDVNAFETNLSINAAQQVLLISITNKDNMVVTKKLLF